MEIGCVVGLVAEGVENEGGKEEVEDEAGGREEVELDDEWRSRGVPSKAELGGELMAGVASDGVGPSWDTCWEPGGVCGRPG